MKHVEAVRLGGWLYAETWRGQSETKRPVGHTSIQKDQALLQAQFSTHSQIGELRRELVYVASPNHLGSSKKTDNLSDQSQAWFVPYRVWLFMMNLELQVIAGLFPQKGTGDMG